LILYNLILGLVAFICYPRVLNSPSNLQNDFYNTPKSNVLVTAFNGFVKMGREWCTDLRASPESAMEVL